MIDLEMLCVFIFRYRSVSNSTLAHKLVKHHAGERANAVDDDVPGRSSTGGYEGLMEFIECGIDRGDQKGASCRATNS
jgi:hypothetical protein